MTPRARNEASAAAGRPIRTGGSSPDPRAATDPKRLRILDAARGVCDRLGYEAATMEAIAAEARVSKGTLYNFFESKEQLFLSTVLQEYDQGEARIAARVGNSEDPRARLEGLLAAMVETFPIVASGMMVNLQVWAVVSRDAESRRRMFDDLGERYRRTSDDLRETLRAGRASGEFRSDLDVAAVANGVAAVFDGFVYRSIFDGESADAGALRAVFDTLICERVLCAAPPESSR